MGHDENIFKGPLERTVTLERQDVAEGEKIVFKASLSSEKPVARWFGSEILVHTKEAINMERAKRGLPFLFNHNMDQPIGLAKPIRLVNGRLEATVELDSGDPFAAELSRKIQIGHLGDVSIRYSIDEYERLQKDGEDDVYTITRWTPLEASLVSVPADSSVGVGRNKNLEGEIMGSSNNSGDNAGQGSGARSGDGEINIVDFMAERGKALDEGKTRGAEAERERIVGINQVFDACRFKSSIYVDLREKCISEGSTVEQARAACFELMNREPDSGHFENTGGAEHGTRSPDVVAGDDQTDKMVEGASRALDARIGMLKDENKRDAVKGNEFASMTMPEMAREFLRRQGFDVSGFSRSDIVGYAFRPDLIPGGRRDLTGHGPSDFANLLSNTAGKRMQQGYEETPETWRQWVHVGQIQDFKQHERPALSNFGSLDEIPSNGEYKHGTMSDLVEYISAKKYGKLFAISREAIINDDLSGLDRAPLAMGRAAARTIGDKVYAVLTDNAAMNQDNVALFNAAHSNIGAAGALSITTLDDISKKLALQTDPGNNAHGLNLQMRYLLVPVALKNTALMLRAAQYDPSGLSGATGGAVRPNVFQNTFEVISEPRLDADSATQFYGVTDPMMHETVEVAFVNGQEDPVLESRDGWTVDGIEYKTRIEVAVAALDYRGMVRNAGA